MRSYILTTSVLFGLLTLAHILRIIVEWPGPARDPWFLLITLATAIMCSWGWLVLRQSAPS